MPAMCCPTFADQTFELFRTSYERLKVVAERRDERNNRPAA